MWQKEVVVTWCGVKDENDDRGIYGVDPYQMARGTSWDVGSIIRLN